MAALSLRDKQIASIKRILNLNAPLTDPDAQDEPTNASADSPIWKVLVFDDMGRDMVAAVLRVKELRAANVTMHLHINAMRHPISDVPVVYLLEPTPQNLQKISTDLSKGLYSPAYINFLSSIPRPLLEDFGAQIVASGAAEKIAQVYDQHLNFVVSEPDLFDLNIKDAYRTINSPQTPDSEIDQVMDRIVSGLFSVVNTLGVVPIIRCAPAGASEVICTRLDRKLRDLVLSSKSPSSTGASRPVLILVDRQTDLTKMFSHSWIYQTLVYDILDVQLTKISIPEDKSHPERGAKTFDTAEDSFWSRNSALPFPTVADNVSAEWNTYQKDADNVTKKTGASSIDDLSGESNQYAAHLKGALAMLPELRERKDMLAKHMSILEAIMEGIKLRKIDAYFQIEEDLAKQTKASILSIIKDSENYGNDPSDKLRLFLSWYLTTEQDISRADLDSFVQALQTAGADTTAINYIKGVRQLTRLTMITSAPTQPAQSTSQLFGGFSSLSSRVSDRLKDAGIGANFEGVLSGLKNFLPTNSDGTLTKITESIMDPSNASSSAISKTENYLYFDPRSANARGTMPPASQSRNNQSTVGRGIEASFGQRRQGYSEAIVFTVGGGSMEEYGNLNEWARRHNASGGAAGTGQKRVIYGSTAIYNASDFINKELAPLGKESS